MFYICKYQSLMIIVIILELFSLFSLQQIIRSFYSLKMTGLADYEGT